MDELYQAEWCPYSQKVRQRMTEMGIDYVARQVPAEPHERGELRRRTGGQEIPALVLEDGAVIAGTDRIVAYLEARHGERGDTDEHHERAREHAGDRAAMLD